MSIRLALELSEKIAAVAPVTAQVSQTMAQRNSTNPVSLMLLNGTKDPLVPYNGGEVKVFKFGRSRGSVLSTDKTIEKFKKINACDNEVKVKKLPNKVANDKTVVEIYNYDNCNKNSEVILVKVIGGGHTWPGGKQYLRPRRVGVVSREINASKMILDFFLRHSRN
jgi:polyhydroxybutyrate depolymerase